MKKHRRAALRRARSADAWMENAEGACAVTKGEKKVTEREFSCCKLEIFLPESHLEPLRQALQAADAGHIGNYDSCLSYSPVASFWRPLPGTEPYLGQVGEISREPEIKLEVTCRRERQEETLAAVREVHPYEETVIIVIPLWTTGLSPVKPAAAARGVTEVVAALLWQGERFLICQRPANKSRGLLW